MGIVSTLTKTVTLNSQEIIPEYISHYTKSGEQDSVELQKGCQLVAYFQLVFFLDLGPADADFYA